MTESQIDEIFALSFDWVNPGFGPPILTQLCDPCSRCIRAAEKTFEKAVKEIARNPGTPAENEFNYSGAE